MDRFINKTKQIIFAQQGGIFSSALIISGMIVISGIFGFLRYRILAGYFTKEELDIFFAAFRLPDLIFEILITGALTSSFIPVFIKYQKNKEELEQHISSIFNLLLIILVLIVIVLYFSMDSLIPLITPGFKGEKLMQVILYSKILLISQLPFLVAGNFLTGIAQAHKTFLITSVAPILYNLSVIVGTLLFASQFHLLAPILGVSVGAVLFFLIQIPIIVTFEINYHLTVKITDGVKEFFKMIGPRILTVIITQIDATIDLSLTSLLGSGSYTIFYFAQHLQLLPVSVIGVAFGQASLPYLSEMVEQGKKDELKKIIIESLLNLFFFTVPIMVFFVFARTPLIRVFFGGEKFDWDATVQTAYTLSYFALSMPFHAVYYFLTRCFYALFDSKTPFIISLFTIALNTLLSLYFILVVKLPIWSLAISFSVSVIANSTILFIILVARLKNMDIPFFIKEIIKMMLASCIASLPAYYLIKLMDNLLLDTSRTINVFVLLASSALLFFLLYLLLSWLLNIKELYSISRLFAKAKLFQKKITEITSYE
ncbi:murein biosynthesis integral membrane protein MurJ [Candidatus Roizmanbacteria bacterium]|nr:murein biosynthesis integral membrane protein MurJ [Candidatus Roizmanbacteria bacterium]